ncbi:hypothetical protein BD779DRAFT_1474808 [Infundibulicybe gibba]|nr:hypothetical protein BD779DRAFT_1474808 [Infundibulicybe gibba]
MAQTPDNEFTIEFERILEERNVEWEWSAPTGAPNIEKTLDRDSDDSDTDDDDITKLPFSEHLHLSQAFNLKAPSTDQTPSGPVIHTIEKAGRVLNVCASPERPGHLSSPLDAVHVSESHFTAAIHTLSTLEPHKTLLVLDITAHPAPKCRFLNVAVTWLFRRCADTDPAGMAVLAPRVLGLAPQHSVGGWTQEQMGCIRAVGSAASPSLTSTMGAMTIEGSIRGRSRCVWTVEENASSQCGIPDQLQFAVALEHSGKFELELDMHGELGFGSFSAPIAAKRGESCGLVKVMDAGAELGQVEWKNFLKGVTGRVPSATKFL